MTMTITERQRQLVIDLIHHHVTLLDKVGGAIARAELKDVPEKLAEAEVAATNFLAQLRIQQAE